MRVLTKDQPVLKSQSKTPISKTQKIHLDQEWKIDFWSEHFNVSSARLVTASRIVGTEIGSLERFLETSLILDI